MDTCHKITFRSSYSSNCFVIRLFPFTGVEQEEGSNSKGVRKQSEPMPDMQKGVREVKDVQISCQKL